MIGRRIVVMGVSGSGKTTVGSAVATRLGWDFVDADDLHPAENVAKMSAGAPLTDSDRESWLNAVAHLLAGRTELVVACSALRVTYRDLLRAGAPDILFVQLKASHEALAERMRNRPGHFMPVSLLNSQLQTLEPLAPGEGGIILDAELPPGVLVEAILRRGGAAARRGAAPPPAAGSIE